MMLVGRFRLPALSFYVFQCFCLVFSADQIKIQTITVTIGENATLPCQDPNISLIVVEWDRKDLNDDYVLLYRGKGFDDENQCPTFKGRVSFLDNQMKDGNVSLVLQSVTANDTGTYECRVQRKGTRDRIVINTIQLNVVMPGKEDENKAGWNTSTATAISVGLPVCIFLLVVGGLMYKYLRKKNDLFMSNKPDEL